MRRITPTSFVAVVGTSLVCASPDVEITVELERPPRDAEAAIDLFASGVDARSLAELCGLTPSRAAEVLGVIAQHGVIAATGDRKRPEAGVALIEAILAAPEPSLVWTAAEALAVPPSLPRPLFRRVLRAFVSGLSDPARLAAYAHAATVSARTVCGDEPDTARVSGALERLADCDRAAIQVVDLRTGSVSSVTVDEFEALGGHAPHRLGPLLAVRRNAELPGWSVLWTAHYALPSLRYHDRDSSRVAHGWGTSDAEAELTARAEAIERYAAGDLAGRTVVRARAAELDASVPPTDQIALSPRQYRDHPDADPYAPDDAYLWTPAYTDGGERRWVVAASVFLPFFDPGRERHLPPATSSGLAAHTAFEEARERALRELVERDAVMWTWVQRVARERIERRSLPASLNEAARVVEGDGHRVDFVNLTLDVAPVVLCAIHDASSLHLGASCRADARQAAAKAWAEATTMVHAAGNQATDHLDERDVRRPIDHHRFFRSPERVELASFLYSSPDEIALEDVAAPFREPLDERLRGGGEALVVDLSSASTRPFHVVRALVPGLIPISFGWDREPLGMPRLISPIETASGERLGRSMAASTRVMPHPFA